MFQNHTLLSACLPSANVFLAAYPDHHRNSDSTTTSAGFPVGAVSGTASRRSSRGQGSQAQVLVYRPPWYLIFPGSFFHPMLPIWCL